jgi:hypothetical protein
VPQCRLGLGADCGGDDSAFEFPGRAERCDGIDFDCDNMLFPALSPCFMVQDMRCVLGRRGCNDSPGAVNAGFAACENDTTGPQASLPMEWCMQICAQPTDPLQCLTADAATCAVSFPGVEANMPCAPPPADIPLPVDQGTGGCNYVLVGAGTQGDWLVTLVSPTLQTGSVVTGCGSFLRVLGARPDAEDRVVLVMTGIGPHLFRLARQNQCPAAGGATVLCSLP